MKRIATIMLMVTVLIGTVPSSIFAQTALSVDVKVNGSDGPVTLNAGDSYTYTWDSQNATACQMTSPVTSGIATSGSSTSISSGSFYPTASTAVTITVTCTDGTTNVSDSVVVQLGSAPNPTVDVKVNGSDGPVTINQGDTYTYTWDSQNATACQMTSPVTSGIAISGSSTAVGPANVAFYPTASAAITVTVTCTNGSNSVTDSAVINLGSTGTSPTVDVKANGSDGPVILNTGDSYTYTWTSANATACQMTSPVASGISLTGSSTPISSGQFYPTTSSSVVITVTCTDGTSNVTDSVTVSLRSISGTTPSIDVKANGSDGPVTLTPGASYTYTWTSANATACQMTTPVASGVSLSGTSTPISSGVFYPSTTTPVTISITCTDGTQNATDSVVINLASSGAPTVDVKANGSDGPVTISNGDAYTYTWVSANATACQMTSPVASGVSLSGTSVPITSGVFYPTTGSPVTITVTCTNGVANATDSVVIQISGGGGGGGGGGGSSSSMVYPQAVTTSCPFIHDYMKMGFQNDPLEVMKLQAFLRVFMGYTYVTVNGVFDQATYQGVGAFQMAYYSEILAPWGHTAPTHYVYILTLKKINEIYCQHELPLTPDEQHEIAAFRALYISTGVASGPSGYNRPASTASEAKEYSAENYVSSTSIAVIPVTTTTTVPVVVSNGQSQGQETRNGLAAALFTFPHGLKDTMQCFYEFALTLIVLYIFGIVLKDVLYADLPENATKRFLAKWMTIAIGLLTAILIAYALGEYCLILPFVVALLLSLGFMALAPKAGASRSPRGSWNMWSKTTVAEKK